MHIFIDQKETNFTLETEKTSGDVVAAVLNWMHSQGFSTHEVLINGKNILMEIFWREIPLGDIEEISFLSHQTIPYRANAIKVVFEWSQKMAEALGLISGSKVSSKTLLPLIAQYPEHELAFLTDFDPVHTKLLDRTLRRTIENHLALCIDDNGKFTDFDLPQFEKSMHLVHMICRERISEIDNSIEEFAKTRNLLPEIMKEITEVGTLAQIGKVQEAFGRILVFIEVVTKLVRLLIILHDQNHKALSMDEEEVKNWDSRAFGALKVLEGAMEQGDSVGIGDVLEYELLPILEELLVKTGSNDLV